MEIQKNILIVAVVVLSFILYQRWQEFQQEYAAEHLVNTEYVERENSSVVPQAADIPEVSELSGQEESGLPSTPEATQPNVVDEPLSSAGRFIEITTDLVRAKINTVGGTLAYLELIEEPETVEQPDIGYKLLKTPTSASTQDQFVAQSGLIGRDGTYPNHHTVFSAEREAYQLNDELLRVPLNWTDERGVQYIKEFVFHRDSYVVDVTYTIKNESTEQISVYPYAQLSRTDPSSNSGGGFGRLPSYLGGVIYTDDEKYQKVDFGDMDDANLTVQTPNGWVAMIEHYFVAAWLPQRGQPKELYSLVSNTGPRPVYSIGYKSLEATRLSAGQSGTIASMLYAGPKEQYRLRAIEEGMSQEGLKLTVDYGWLTVVASPLFWLLEKIHGAVGNWGWAIIFLTILIKALFYPLSAASYKSMAAMKRLQPRMATLKERYADDKQKFQAAMMELYKAEKVNPAGGCLPILIQIPVFLALYWVLLESVELRQADFALWWNDLSSPDPYYVLPVLMGASMFFQQKLNPAPVDPMQQKIMMFMPLVLTFLFLSFPQGLVLYWVVNNCLSIAQQWLINKRAGAT
ncbi:MAG: membrane protein insertase YidC [Proteobacteria bacterium]|jgi:YidC/Oxa1 family membrane protein insertase|nr:membrane protein insertase YidC [Pseudomonadota bacterium]